MCNKINNLNEIELGLDRVKQVADTLGVLATNAFVITVGGTNGKGSTVACLDAIYREAGYRVGTFTSPMLFKRNEQITIQGTMAEDQEINEAYQQIAHHKGKIHLTPFEYQTLAALLIFQSYQLDILLLEVGLGGRLDAVNIMDADLAIVTSIDIDHTEWLGDTREAIAYEKAGIFRAGKPAICGDPNPPSTLVESASHINALLYCQEKDFYYEKGEKGWSWNGRYQDLPFTELFIQNMSTALMAISLSQAQLPVSEAAIRSGLTKTKLMGRIQMVPGSVNHLYDVSHNPASVALLAAYLKQNRISGKNHAIFSMLSDKDMLTSIQKIKDDIDEWHVAPLQTARTSTKEALQDIFQQADLAAFFYDTISEACFSVERQAQPGDRVIIFGSFHTVAEAYITAKLSHETEPRA
ncbi:MAG TPA: bifunctional tetrahydrofolate synthase/dihydrofolate synthase [Gammaproteobacteria bacterium]|jgi:dihydrofolate synthase/folylpolyglutamate synthase|nr:bifunctional tetrahydrofolate synthase/dihydrofolate synthase [Gammaproteobacteria bacterium]